MAKEMTIEQIQALMDSMHKNEISELVYEVEEFRLKIKGLQAPSIAPAPAPAAAGQAAPVAVAVAAAEASVPAPEKQPEGKVITCQGRAGGFRRGHRVHRRVDERDERGARG